MKFEFKAFTQDGKLKEGIITANDKDAAIKLLQDQGLLVTYLQEKKISLLFLFRKPGLNDLYLFTKQLSYLLKARTPLDEAIKTLSQSNANPIFKSILIEIYNDLVAGVTFSQSLSRFPEIFNSYYVGMVIVGESVGTLDEILDYLANHLNAQRRFKSRLLQAAIYPIVVVSLFIGVMIALFYFVIPQITKLFTDNGIPLPGVTKLFQSISDFIINFGLFLLIIFGFMIYYFVQYVQTREGRAALFRISNGLPIFGSLIKNLYTAQFLESLFYLLKGGVPIVESLQIIKTSINHPLYEDVLEVIIEDVKKGMPLSQSLSNFPDLFPNLVIEGMRTSEKTGQLAEVTLTIYGFYNEAIEAQVAGLAESLQPILIIFLGAGLGILEASLLIPLLELTKYVQTF
ncbi:MAG: type II secretion system protein F [Candidatus Parcubacteria bacterium]|nr:MAG: type II secretion system protein F [Candidatus Parcubacteria bacterium]